MVNPTTVNVGLIVPLTGADVDTWGEDDVNPDFVAIDGMLGGVQSVSLSNIPVTLSSPAGFIPTPGAGPNQAQNRVLRFTGTLLADVTVTLPFPAAYIVENFTTGNFDVILRGVTATTEVIAIPQGETHNIYNDGSRVRFTSLGRMGQMEHWAGISSMPSWVAKCTVIPYLLCDATAYNVADYPYLGARLLGKFGGNGVTTFTNPDMRGRVPLAYDGTGTRITVAGCGINGQTIGATLDQQTVTLARANLPNTSISCTVTDPGHVHTMTGLANYVASTSPFANYDDLQARSGGPISGHINSAVTGISVAFNLNGNVAQTNVNNVQPSIVTGIWVIKT